MASVPSGKAIGGVTPLGVITITANTPVQIVTPSTVKDKVGFTFTARLLGFSCPASNTGAIYVNYGNYPGLDANATALIVSPGATASLPINDACTEGLIDVEKWYCDGSHTGDIVAVHASDASS